MELLIQSLETRRRQEAYEQIKTAVQVLEPRNAIGLNLFTKPQEPAPKVTAYRYVHDPSDLLAAFARMAERSEKKIPPPVAAFEGIVGREPYPVTTKAAQILKRLVKSGVTKFRSLFQGSRSRSEIVATFMAVLELCRLSSVRVDPNEAGELSVTYLKMPDESALPQQEE
jgi:segregation and condensation protein A